ncbi:hypothetical protein BS297_11900 [Rhodococcus erythropolis]|uniref:Uncharacterized protein n=1 Tax=Rhodococcus erythropolis TaxID=1833 RepID=A0A5N5E500_RHOER|nr:hypothetical protein BS297_11900 [Rhodococcus erythropolis]
MASGQVRSRLAISSDIPTTVPRISSVPQRLAATEVSVGADIVGGVSVQIGVHVEISGLRDDREQVGMTMLLTKVMREHRMDDEVFVSMRGKGADLSVHADSGDHKLIFNGFYLWGPAFEEMLTARATQLVSHAQVDYEWEFEEDEF